MHRLAKKRKIYPLQAFRFIVGKEMINLLKILSVMYQEHTGKPHHQVDVENC